jgi:hypothetical protein
VNERYFGREPSDGAAHVRIGAAWQGRIGAPHRARLAPELRRAATGAQQARRDASLAIRAAPPAARAQV